MPELGDPVSERELDVLYCLIEGDSNREIAEKLSISPNTVKVHVRNIFTKLGVSSRAEATTIALQKGVVSIPGLEAEEPEIEVEETAPEPSPVVTDDTEEGALAGEEHAGIPVVDAPEPSQESDSAPIAPATLTRPWPKTNRRLILLFGTIFLATLLIVALAATGIFDGSTAAGPTSAASTSTAPPPTPRYQETEIDENWLISRPLPQPRAHMATTSVGLNIYAIAGESVTGIDNSVAIYNTQERVWSAGAPKLTAVADAGAAVLGGEIYVVGGRLANGQATAVVEAYSPLNDGWRPIPSLPRPVAGSVVLADGGLLYVFGGDNADEDVLADAYAFDPGTQRWQTLAPLPTARAFAAGGALGGRFYVAGGRDEAGAALDVCEVYDPQGADWSPCPPLLQPRAAAGAAVLLNRLYLMGDNGNDGAGGGEVYDPTADTWSAIGTPMLEESEGWSYLGVANVETRVYALGGLRGEHLSDEMFVFRPLVYQFFIPAAPSGGD
jgi:DNA-binding CsgD family transcriptional regulator/N-acetylneuraminic acid mutarotase